MIIEILIEINIKLEYLKHMSTITILLLAIPRVYLF